MSINDLLNLAHDSQRTTDPHDANDLALRLSRAAADLTATIGGREAKASAYRADLAQEYVDGKHGEVALKPTPAHEAAGRDERWITHQQRLTSDKTDRERLIGYAQFFRARCTMLTQDRELIHV